MDKKTKRGYKELGEVGKMASLIMGGPLVPRYRIGALGLADPRAPLRVGLRNVTVYRARKKIQGKVVASETAFKLVEQAHPGRAEVRKKNRRDTHPPDGDSGRPQARRKTQASTVLRTHYLA